MRLRCSKDVFYVLTQVFSVHHAQDKVKLHVTYLSHVYAKQNTKQIIAHYESMS